jgi:hypothetical protein
MSSSISSGIISTPVISVAAQCSIVMERHTYRVAIAVKRGVELVKGLRIVRAVRVFVHGVQILTRICESWVGRVRRCNTSWPAVRRRVREVTLSSSVVNVIDVQKGHGYSREIYGLALRPLT